MTYFFPSSCYNVSTVEREEDTAVETITSKDLQADLEGANLTPDEWHALLLKSQELAEN